MLKSSFAPRSHFDDQPEDECILKDKSPFVELTSDSLDEYMFTKVMMVNDECGHFLFSPGDGPLKIGSISSMIRPALEKKVEAFGLYLYANDKKNDCTLLLSSTGEHNTRVDDSWLMAFQDLFALLRVDLGQLEVFIVDGLNYIHVMNAKEGDQIGYFKYLKTSGTSQSTKVGIILDNLISDTNRFREIPSGVLLSGATATLVTYCESRQLPCVAVLAIREVRRSAALYKSVEVLMSPCSDFVGCHQDNPSTEAYLDRCAKDAFQSDTENLYT